MDKSKPKPNPKKTKDEKRIRKVSLPASKVQSRICIDELRQNFKRQISLPKERDIVPLYDPMTKAQESAPVVRGKTAVIFDETTSNHFCPWDENFPENPERLNCILRRCKDLDLFSDCELLTPVSATLDQIRTVHTKSLYNILKQSQNESHIEVLKKLSEQYDSIYVNQKTFDAALSSAGCCIYLTDTVLQGEVHNGIALVRPPGHHAMSNEFCGYCFFNNAALAARFALSKVGRILVVDWDVHHGQGTQRIFYDDPRVLYFSTHRYENGRFWPNLRESDFDYCGEGDGIGFNFNLPLNETGMGNAEFLAYFHQVLLPVAYEFNPELVLISSGFDASLGCAEGMMRVTPALFAHLTSMLMPLAGGKVAVFLEGGYCPESLSESSMHTLRALMGRPCPRLIDAIESPCQSMRDTVLNVIFTHRSFWKCLRFQTTHNDSDESRDDLNFSQMRPKESSLQSVELEFESLPKFTPKVVFEEPSPPLPQGTIYPITDCYSKYPEEDREKLRQELKRLQKETCLEMAPNSMSFVYDPDMEKHCNTFDKTFPERPARTKEIMKRLADFGILDRVLHLRSRRAIRSELCLVHEDKLVDLMAHLVNMTPRDRNSLADDYTSIYFNEHTWDSARLAAGSLLQVVDAVCAGQSQTGLALIRPPGHHAESGTPNGFCFFNNVSIAAKYAMQKYLLKRIMIVDWDVHHGNGIQHCFESTSSVLYISIHVYKEGNFFPYSKEGDSSRVGIGPGIGYNINIPWSKTGMGDGDYISAFTQIVLPIGYQFDPDLVLVSAGFDAAVNDPLGGCCVTPECYGHLTHLLSLLANRKLILALEGGYNLTSISHCMVMCAKALLGDPLPPLSAKLTPSQSAIKTMNQVIRIHKEFWSCFKFQVSLPKSEPSDITTSAPYKEESSDAEFLTPPQSPPDLSSTQKLLSETACTNTSTVTGSGEVTDTLIAEFSAMDLNDPSTTAGKELLEAESNTDSLEGAVGIDIFSQVTLVQMMQENNELYAVVPSPWCPHLEEVNPLPESGIDIMNARCQECYDEKENWQCLVCYTVLCGRYVREHMVQHGLREGHNIVLSHADLSVWCYSCETYVHNEVLFPSQQSAYRNKFGEEMPSSNS